jgi:enhancing lycopene biosynthesis protein 2
MSKKNIEMKLQPVGLMEVAFGALQKLKDDRLILNISTDIDTDNICRSLNEISSSIDGLTNTLSRMERDRRSE